MKKLCYVIALLSVLFITGCAASGAKYSSEAGAAADKENIVVYRPYRFQSGALYANVYVDGQKVGKLKNSGYLKLNVGSGKHTLRVGSQTREISISDNKQLFFRFTHGWALFAAIDVIDDTLDTVEERFALEEIKDTNQSI